MTSPIGMPGRIMVHPDGMMDGASAGYAKHLGDMAGVYRDEAAYQAKLAEAGADSVVYVVAEHRALAPDNPQDGALIIGTSTLLPGRYGAEYALTRGHLHRIADRAELYYCLSGRGVMLLETLTGHVQAIELTAGQAAHVPGHWIHRSVNVSDVPFVTMFCYCADSGQDYELIARAGGMAHLIVATDAGGWALAPNPDHLGYQS